MTSGSGEVVPPDGVLPALVVAHDADGRDVLDIVRSRRLDDHLVTVHADEFTPDVLVPVMRTVGTDDAFVVIHLAGPLVDTVGAGWAPDEKAADIAAGAAAVHHTIEATFPTMSRLHGWLVAAVGQQMDGEEGRLVQRLLHQHGLRGVIVTASATRTAVMHPRDEQLTFCADAVLALTASPLEHQLAHSGRRTWAFGASSATYDVADLVASTSAHLALEAIEDHLVAPPEGVTSSRDLGREAIDDMGLGVGRADAPRDDGQDERTRLLTDSSGGSVVSRFRSLGLDFAALPLRQWATAIATAYELKLRNEVPVAAGVVDRNRRRRVGQLRPQVQRGVASDLEETTSFPAGIDFCRGLQDGLDEARTAVAAKDRHAPTDIAGSFAALRQLLRQLPFGPAVATRVFALALVVLVVLGELLGQEGPESLRWLDRPYARLAAVAIAAVGYWLYQRRLARTLRLRDSIVARVEEDLVSRVEELVVDARLAVLDELIELVGRVPRWWQQDDPPSTPVDNPSISEWLAWVAHRLGASRDLLQNVADARDPARGAAGGSRWSVRLPSPEQVSTAALVHDRLDGGPGSHHVARLITRLLGPAGPVLEVPSVEQLVETVTSQLGVTRSDFEWQSLTALLEKEPVVRRRVQELVERDLTPNVGPAAAADAMPLHYLMVADGQVGRMADLVLARETTDPVAHRITRELTTVARMAATDTVAMVHLVELDIEAAVDDLPEAGP